LTGTRCGEWGSCEGTVIFLVRFSCTTDVDALSLHMEKNVSVRGLIDFTLSHNYFMVSTYSITFLLSNLHEMCASYVVSVIYIMCDLTLGL